MDNHDQMTTFIENRSAGDLLAGFLVLSFTAAGVLGAMNFPAGGLVAGVLAVLVIGIWTVWRTRPPSELRISRTEITYGRGDRISTRWVNGPGVELVAGRNRNAQWLSVAGDRRAVINLLGFDVVAVARACALHGWRFR